MSNTKSKFALFQPLGWRELSGIAVQGFQELTDQAMPRASGLQTQSLMSILQNCACSLVQLKSDLSI